MGSPVFDPSLPRGVIHWSRLSPEEQAEALQAVEMTHPDQPQETKEGGIEILRRLSGKDPFGDVKAVETNADGLAETPVACPILNLFYGLREAGHYYEAQDLAFSLSPIYWWSDVFEVNLGRLQREIAEAGLAARPIALFRSGLHIHGHPDMIEENGRLLVCAEILARGTGYKFNFDPESGVARFKRPQRDVQIRIGEPTVRINGQPFELHTVPRMSPPPVLVPEELEAKPDLLVPLREVAHALGCRVQWDERLRIAHVILSEWLKTGPRE